MTTENNLNNSKKITIEKLKEYEILIQKYLDEHCDNSPKIIPSKNKSVIYYTRVSCNESE